MDADQDVAVGVDLQEVSIHGVKDEPPEDGSGGIWEGVCECLDFLHLSAERQSSLGCVSPGGERRVVDKAEQLLRVSDGNEALHC